MKQFFFFFSLPHDMTIEHSLVSHNLSLTSGEGSGDDGHVIHVIANGCRRTLAGRRAAAGVAGR